MVLTVTINPLLERRLFFNKIDLGKVNRSSKEIFKTGGKGINVSRQLNHLKIKNQAYLPLGGTNGKIYREILRQENIDFVYQPINNETRYGFLTIEESNNNLTSYFSPDAELSPKEAEQFKSRLDKMIQNCSIVVFAGSSPSEFADKIFPYGIELANKHDKISILDTYGNHLESCLEQKPFAFHNNINELNNSLKINLVDESDKREFLLQSYAKGAKMVFLTDGANDTFASKFDFHYRIKNPVVKQVDPTGSGDAFVSGIIFGLERAFVYEDTLKLASALGAANAAKFDVCNVSHEEIDLLKDKIEIYTLGKKMKIIDDSPTV
ncbi:MAG: PfkB family carbohydrate kinase [Ignavibacteria bacterium]